MGFTPCCVEDFHGPNEKGKDVYFSYTNIFGRYKHCCFFIKKGNIKKSGKNDIRKMRGAIDELVGYEFTSPIDNKSPIRIEEFYFVCSGKINREARDWLTEFLVRQRSFSNFSIFDVDSLIKLIIDLIKKFNYLMMKEYEFYVENFKDYVEEIINYNQREHVVNSAYYYSEGKIIKS